LQTVLKTAQKRARMLAMLGAASVGVGPRHGVRAVAGIAGNDSETTDAQGEISSEEYNRRLTGDYLGLVSVVVS
jgi:hypothetical protein